jgi:hypothetical protein
MSLLRIQRTSGVFRVAMVACMVSGVGCATQTVVETEIIQTDVSDAEATVQVVPACEAGQALTEDGCSDVILSDSAGDSVNLHNLALGSACEQAWSKVERTAAERRALTASRGVSLQVGLEIVNSECSARQQHLSLCERAGYFEQSGDSRAFRVRCRDRLISCRRLANVYRDMIAGGLRITQ